MSRSRPDVHATAAETINVRQMCSLTGRRFIARFVCDMSVRRAESIIVVSIKRCPSVRRDGGGVEGAAPGKQPARCSFKRRLSVAGRSRGDGQQAPERRDVDLTTHGTAWRRFRGSGEDGDGDGGGGGAKTRQGGREASEVRPRGHMTAEVLRPTFTLKLAPSLWLWFKTMNSPVPPLTSLI